MKVRIASAAATTSCRWTRTSRGRNEDHPGLLDLVAEVRVADGLVLDEVDGQVTGLLERALQREVAGRPPCRRATELDQPSLLDA